METRRDSPTVLKTSLEVLSPLLADLGQALGWVAAQVLLFVQPLAEGWMDQTVLERVIRKLEALLSLNLPEDG